MVTAGASSQIKPLAERLEQAAELPVEVWEQADRLARQLDDSPVVPLIGAGTSLDCGHALARDISKAMYGRYRSRFGTAAPPSDLANLDTDMGVVADALYTAGKQEGVIDALGLADKAKWPDKDSLSDHFCSYRVLARLAREGFFSEAITLNYDCAFERGLDDEGFLLSPWRAPIGAWLNQATVVPDGAAHVKLEKRGEMVVTKAHGCAATYRREMEGTPIGDARERVEEAIVVRRGQLLDWRTDLWARDLLADRARRHVILMLGISGQDPVIHIALTRVLEEVYRHLGGPGESCPEPRVVVIDRSPDTVALRTLIHQGCGGVKPDPGVVTHLEVPDGSSMTAVLTALATQMLVRRLEREGGPRLPQDPMLRIISLMVAAPASLRWAFRLERRSRGTEFHQRAILEQVGEKGYVPLSVGANRAIESLRVRRLLRERLNLGSETVQEAVRGHGFVAPWVGGRAFLPLGITPQELMAIPTSAFNDVARTFDVPAGLDLVVVAGEGEKLVGRSLPIGGAVEVP